MSEIEHYLAPATLDEAAEALRGGEATILAAGTDLMLQAAEGRVAFKRTLVNITRLAELKGISVGGGEIRLGALTTITELMENAEVQKHLPALVEAGDQFASDQLRNAATIGGNIANASPAGDMLVPFLIYDARVELASKPDGKLETRAVPMAEFFSGPGQTVARADEIVTAAILPLPPAGQWSTFYKFGVRPALDISTISFGLAGVREAGALVQVRVAFGAVAATPVRAAKTEAALEGAKLDAESIARIAAVARDEIKPIDDLRASAWYRQEMMHNMIKRTLTNAAAPAD